MQVREASVRVASCFGCPENWALGRRAPQDGDLAPHSFLVRPRDRPCCHPRRPTWAVLPWVSPRAPRPEPRLSEGLRRRRLLEPRVLPACDVRIRRLCREVWDRARLRWAPSSVPHPSRGRSTQLLKELQASRGPGKAREAPGTPGLWIRARGSQSGLAAAGAAGAAGAAACAAAGEVRAGACPEPEQVELTQQPAQGVPATVPAR